MTFEPMVSVFPEQTMWGATAVPFSFIIVEEEGEYSVSVRQIYKEGEMIEPGKLGRLGSFDSMNLAVESCEKWLKEHRQ